MKRTIEDIFAKWRGVYSGAILVKTGEETVFAAATGLAHRGFAIPNQLDTKFDTASVTKTFTAAAILLLVEQGLLRLTDRIVDVVDLQGTQISPDVRIEHLLNHTSGIADDADEEAGEDYADLFVDRPNYAIRTCSDFLPQFAYKAPNFAPGTDVRYNNCAFILLGLAIEAVTGQAYREFVTGRVFRACGMEHTLFCAMDEVNPGAAEGYIADRDADGNVIQWRKNIYSFPPIGTADGGTYTTVGDLDIFLRAIKGHRLLTPLYSDMLCAPHCAHTSAYRLGTGRTGYAFEFIENEEGTPLLMYKEGQNAGVDAMFSYYPSLDLSVNLLSNENGSLYPLNAEIRAFLFEYMKEK